MCLTVVQAQVPSDKPLFYFDHLDVGKGLSQSSVLSIYQDHYGFMWLGTRDGLNKYNGYSFEVFKHQPGDSTSLSGNIINDIAEDQDHNLWVATQNGLSFYHRKKNTFKNFTYSGEGRESQPVYKIFIDAKKNIWVGGPFGLFKFDVNKGVFQQTDAIKKYIDSHGPFSVNAIEQGFGGNILVGANDFKVFMLNPDTNSFSRFPINYSNGTSRVEALLSGPNGNLWIGTYGSGLFKVNGKGEVLAHYHTKAGIDKRLSDNNIRALEFDNAGNIWIGTFNGLNILGANDKLTIVGYDEGNLKGLSHSSIRAIKKDDKGSIWIGTYFGGVNIFDKDNQRFQHHYHVPNSTNSISYNVVGAFAQHHNLLFIGTERGGLSMYDENKKVYINDKLPQLQKATIKSLYLDNAENLWIGVFKKGLYSYHLKNQRVESYPKNQPEYNFLKEAIINAMVEDKNGNLWLATDAKGGLHKFNLSSKKFVNYSFKEELQNSIHNTPIKSIGFYNENTLLMATKGKGVLAFNTETGNVKRLNPLKSNLKNSTVDEFNHVFVDKKGTVWLASNGSGLFFGTLEDENFNVITSKENLVNNQVLGVLDDRLGNIWAITLSGISKLSPQNRQVVASYTNQSGLPLTEINEGAIYKNNNGEFLLGGNNGYVVFNPETLSNNTYVPKLAFTSLSISNKKVYPGDQTGILDEDITKTKNIKLRWFQSVLTLEFAALSYLKPENNHYQYKLQGFNEDWILLENRQPVTFTNLKSGNYVFMVKGSNNDGLWNPEPLTLGIEVLPPPWKTWWAYALYAVLIATGFYIIRYNAVKSTQLKHSLKLEQLEKQRWKEVHDLKLKYFTDVSHEFRTPLTLIMAPLEELLDKKLKKPDVKGMVKNMYFHTKRLLHLIDQILEIREIETGHYQLKPEPVYMEWLIQEIVHSFNNLADKKQIKLTFTNVNLPDVPVMADKDKVEKIFFNLLSNAFKFTPRGGEISVKAQASMLGNLVEYTFELADTGTGITENDLPKIFDRFYKTDKQKGGAGIGLSLTKSLVELMHGSIYASSKAGTGTVFYITFSLEKTNATIEPPLKQPYTPPIPLEFGNTANSSQKTFDSSSAMPTILVVEDNTDIRNYLKEKLSGQYHVLIAKNGEKGILKAKKHGPELIISDVMMPKIDGYQLCKEIKTTLELSHIPVILLTAKSSQIDKMEGLEYGADDYLVKPFNISELKLRVKNILKNRKLLQERFKNNALAPLVQGKMLNSFDEKLMASIVKVIQQNLDRPNFTVEFLGAEVGLSRVHLFRKLKSLTGLTPTDFIKQVRMKNAEELLLLNKFKPAEVAYMVGFQDVKYFSKCFKAYSGKSPSEYSAMSKTTV